MRNRVRWGIVLGLGVSTGWLGSACSDPQDDDPLCHPDESRSCVCPAGGTGTEVCRDDGSGWGSCEGCNGTGGSGAAGAGGTGGGGGSGGAQARVGLYETYYGDGEGQGIWAAAVDVASADSVLAGGAHDCIDPNYCRDAVVAKISHGGAPIWMARFRNEYSSFGAVTRDAAGNSYALGSTGSEAPPINLFVAKLDAGGSPVWQKTIAHELAHLLQPLDITLNEDGSVGVLGRVNSLWCDGPCGCESNAVYYYTLDAQSGSLLTEQAVAWPGSASFVSDGFIVPTTAAGCIQPGNICDTLTIKKYDQAGQLEWTKGYPSYEETPGGDKTYIRVGGIRDGIIAGELPDGYVVFVNPGSAQFPGGGGLLLQTDKDGVVSWMQIVNAAPSDTVSTLGEAILAFSDGGFMLSSTNGFSNVGNVLSRFGADGSLLGAMALGEPARLDVLAHLSPGTFVGAGKPVGEFGTKMLVGRFPVDIPAGEHCPAAGLSFDAVVPLVTPVTPNEGYANDARPFCTFASAALSDVSFYVADQTLLLGEHCE